MTVDNLNETLVFCKENLIHVIFIYNLVAPLLQKQFFYTLTHTKQQSHEKIHH
jgi:hypothetical protein